MSQDRFSMQAIGYWLLAMSCRCWTLEYFSAGC